MASFFGSRTSRPLARIAAAGLLALGLAGAGLTGSAMAQSAAPAAPAAKPAAPAAKPAMPAPAATPAATTPAAPLLDINSATKEELSALKGIGAVRSEAIIKGRPYKGKDDLVQKKIITKAVYDGIKDQIIAKQK